MRQRKMATSGTMACIVQNSTGDECSVTDCGKPATVKGMCKRHYNIEYKRSRRVYSQRILSKRHMLMFNDVREIRALHQQGWSQADIARKFGVSQPGVWAIVHRKTWQNIT